ADAKGELPVDTGFIVFNHRTYPVFTRFLKKLGVEEQDSDMSFSYYDSSANFQYSSDFPNGVFADRRNIFRPSFYAMFKDIMRFNRSVKVDFYAGRLKDKTLGQYLNANSYGGAFVRHYLTPMAAAIWSAPLKKIMDFPCDTFIRFYENHGILDMGHGVEWKTVKGGSQTYVRSFLNGFKGMVYTSRAAVEIERADGVNIRLSDGTTEIADAVVIATHADQALRLLKDPTADERRLLGPWQYSKNHTALHTDPSRMPSSRRAWVSWNYIKSEKHDFSSPVSLTYYMNRLQRLSASRDYFVSLNQKGLMGEDRIVYQTYYEHPQYDFSSIDTQKSLPSLNGPGNTYFCGSYFGYGFHEDGARAALSVCERLGATL
nr:FAD-dependent oxidoreductase [Candidatus Omnitrophota bacterium]